MSTKIRLTRTGKKKQAHYRLVVTDSRSPRDGKFLEQIGSYNPKTNPVELKLKTDRVIHWIEKGARPSETVSKLLKSQGLWPPGVTAVKGGEPAEADKGTTT